MNPYIKVFDKNNAISVFLFICVILPAGSVFGVNVKVISLLFVLIAIAVHNNGKYFYKLVVLFIPTLICVLLEVLYSYIINHRVEYIFFQAKDILIFFLMVLICTISLPEKEMESVAVKAIIRALCIAALIKMAMLFFSFISGVPVSQVVGGVSGFFNVTIMTFDIDDSSIGRINFTSDAILPFALFIVTSRFMKGTKGKGGYVTLLLLSFSVLISMSRFYWAASMFSVMLATVGSINKRKAFFSIVSIFMLVMLALSSSSVQNMITSRFSDRNNDSSDNTRLLQYEKISKEIEDYPIMGRGMGYYMPDYIRSDDMKYSYELQIPALVMQVGFLGTTLLILSILLACAYQSKSLRLYYKYCYFFLLLIWLSSGMFNPVLLSSSGGIVFVLMMAIPNINLFNR